MEDEEGGPANDTADHQNGAGDPVLIGGGAGGAVVASAVRVPQDIDGGAFEQCHHHCSCHRYYCANHFSYTRFLFQIHPFQPVMHK